MRKKTALVVLEWTCPHCKLTQASATNPGEVKEGGRAELLCDSWACNKMTWVGVSFRLPRG